jgi:hypothetical protein
MRVPAGSVPVSRTACQGQRVISLSSIRLTH